MSTCWSERILSDAAWGGNLVRSCRAVPCHLFDTCKTLFFKCLTLACRWEDPQDLAGKARSYIDANWGAAHRLHHAAHGQ